MPIEARGSSATFWPTSRDNRSTSAATDKNASLHICQPNQRFMGTRVGDKHSAANTRPLVINCWLGTTDVTVRFDELCVRTRDRRLKGRRFSSNTLLTSNVLDYILHLKHARPLDETAPYPQRSLAPENQPHACDTINTNQTHVALLCTLLVDEGSRKSKESGTLLRHGTRRRGGNGSKRDF